MRMVILFQIDNYDKLGWNLLCRESPAVKGDATAAAHLPAHTATGRQEADPAARLSRAQCSIDPPAGPIAF